MAIFSEPKAGSESPVTTASPPTTASHHHNNDSSSDSPDTQAHASKKTKFKRNYLACLNCRTRKVKCDLGSVDNPHDPPCARCKRERKECVFVESKRGGSKNVITGRKRKLEQQQHTSLTPSFDFGRNVKQQLPPLTGQPGSTSQFLESFKFSGQPNALPSLSSLSQSYKPSVPPLTTNTLPLPQTTAFNVPQLPSLSLTHPTSTTSNLRSTPSDVPILQRSRKDSMESRSDSRTSFENSNQSIASNSTMVYLAHLGGRPAKADDRDRIDARERIEELESKLSSKRSMSPASFKHTQSSDSLADSNNNTSAPRLNKSGSASSKDLANEGLTPEEYLKEKFGHDNSLFPTIRNNRLAMPAVKSTLEIRPKPTSNLSDIDYIGEGDQYVLTEDEARKLIHLYTITMHPFFPYIPQDLLDPDVLPGYPMLLCAILAISSRYHTMESINGNDNTDQQESPSTTRHIGIHEQLWIYCQRLISMTVWGEQSSRTIGTLLSFLLFTEWNPRAIHFRWSDYANAPEDDNNDEAYAGLSAMKRSEIMSFMLIGVATRISFLLDEHPLVFMATHIAEINSAIGMNKRSMLSQTLSEVDVNDASYSFTPYQKATIELLKFTSLCYESLYGQNPRLGTLDKYQNLAILDILSPILENWYKKYYKLLKPSNSHFAATLNNSSNNNNNNDDTQIDWLNLPPKIIKDTYTMIEREQLILDYYYTKLFLYSLALSGDTSVRANNTNSKKGRDLRLDELSKYSRYVELAYSAAKEVLFVIQRVNKLKMLKYMPVRWVTRVIRAVAFVVKCYLTLTNDDQDVDEMVTGKDNPDGAATNEIIKLSVIPMEEIITLLQKTAICLRDAAPDELHLCTRYSTILMYLCSQFKTKLKSKVSRNVVDYEQVIKERDYEEHMKQVQQQQMARQQRQQQQQEQQQTNDRQAQFDRQHQPPTVLQQQQHPQPTSQRSSTETQQQFNGSSSIPDLGANKPNQQLFENYFLDTDAVPSDSIFNWFSSNNNPGLDFADEFTKEIEIDFINKHQVPPTSSGSSSLPTSNANAQAEVSDNAGLSGDGVPSNASGPAGINGWPFGANGGFRKI